MLLRVFHSKLFGEFFPEELWPETWRAQVAFPHLVPGKDLVSTFQSSKVPWLESLGGGWWEMKQADYQVFFGGPLNDFSREKMEDFGCTWVITSVGCKSRSRKISSKAIFHHWSLRCLCLEQGGRIEIGEQLNCKYVPLEESRGLGYAVLHKELMAKPWLAGNRSECPSIFP